jgi:hypothetical protein
MKSASVATSRLRLFTLLLPIVAGVALDVLENRKVQLFRHTNTGRFLSVLRNAVCVTLAVFLITYSYTLHLRNPERATHSTNKN